MRCPSCGLENGADETYCADCGALLTSAPVVLEQRVRQDLLIPTTVLGQRYRIESGVASGVFNIYRAVRLSDKALCRIIEDAEAPAVSSPAAPPDAEETDGAAEETADEAETPEPAEAPATPVEGDLSHATLVWRALAGLSNSHLWRVNDFLYHEGRAFTVGQPLPAWNLEDYLADAGNLAAEEIRALGLALLEGLSILHQRRFLHLGVHPAQIYIADDGLAVLDGWERLASLDAMPDVYSVIEGYSSPEAYGIGSTPCPASDVYGVGVTLYFVASRSVPAPVSREQFFFFPPLSARAPGVPPALERVVMKALSKDVRLRYASAQEMHEALDGLSLDGSASDDGMGERVPVGAAVAVGAAGAAGGPAVEAAPRAAVSPASAAPSPTAVRPAARVVRRAANPYELGRIGMKSHVGCVRSVNQDSLLAMTFSAWEHSHPCDALLLVVADGMGGEAEGDKASSLAIRSMAAHLVGNHIPVNLSGTTARLHSDNPSERLEELMRDSMETANQVVFEYSQQDSARRGMGSTLTAVMIDWPDAVFGHAGDTRAYLLHKDGAHIDQVTEDHSLVGKLVRLGQMTREEARVSPQRSYLYRALGTQTELEMDTYARTLEEGDRLLICCDGIWEYYSEEELIAFLSAGDDPQETCERLVEETLRRGADDNCTAVIMHVNERIGSPRSGSGGNAEESGAGN